MFEWRSGTWRSGTWRSGARACLREDVRPLQQLHRVGEARGAPVAGLVHLWKIYRGVAEAVLLHADPARHVEAPEVHVRRGLFEAEGPLPTLGLGVARHGHGGGAAADHYNGAVAWVLPAVGKVEHGAALRGDPLRVSGMV